MAPEDPIYAALFNYTRALSVALGYRDQLTRLHSDRVLGLSEALGRACKLSAEELGVLKIAASLHDVGKIGIPDHVLLKPAQLDKAEWETIKRHSELGQKIMAATELEGTEQASLLIRYHHERYDGLGYPDCLSAEDIPICSRIIGIADSYDAMAVTRAYHPPKMHREVMAIMDEETGGKHDPALMRIFCQIVESSQYKAGSAT